MIKKGVSLSILVSWLLSLNIVLDTDYETPCFIHFKHFDNFVSLTFISLLFVDDDLFSNFVSASSAAESADHLSAPSCDSSNQTKPTATEDDFFNQVGFKIQSHKSFLLWVGVSIRFVAFFFPSKFFFSGLARQYCRDDDRPVQDVQLVHHGALLVWLLLVNKHCQLTSYVDIAFYL